MKAFKHLQVAALVAMISAGVSTEASADWQDLIGGAAGALIGNQIGGGNGKTIATVVGGVAGHELTDQVRNGSDSPTYHDNRARSGSGFSGKEAAGTIGGGALGAILGNQIGGGRGKVIATIIGGVTGALIGKSLTKPEEFVMRDAEGRSWTNGTEPMNPNTELPTFKRGIAKAQQDYAAYADATNRASLAKNDHDWQRISDNDYYTIRSQMFNAGSVFERSRSELNQMASTVASTYNKKIDIDHLLVIASCNAVPVSYNDNVSFNAVIQEGKHCSPSFRPGV